MAATPPLHQPAPCRALTLINRHPALRPKLVALGQAERENAMPAHLIIEDGQPLWWDSADIWVVPGNDPNGAPGARSANAEPILVAKPTAIWPDGSAQ